ncbi:MAG TPA: hypothetical protein VN903_10405, partial [Polyangia bacterium]|nr:hypothetical protein [Polyangia bacterium]
MSRLGFASFVVLIASLGPRTAGATDVAPGAHDTETWTAAGSPYRLTDNVTFSALTVEAGATVLFATLDSGATRLVTLDAGAFTVTGTRENPATFRPDLETTSKAAWRGIIVHGATSVRGARLLNASDGIQLFDSLPSTPMRHLSIAQSAFEGGTYAVQIQKGDVDIDAILVSGQLRGVVMLGSATTA